MDTDSGSDEGMMERTETIDRTETMDHTESIDQTEAMDRSVQPDLLIQSGVVPFSGLKTAMMVVVANLESEPLDLNLVFSILPLTAPRWTKVQGKKVVMSVEAPGSILSIRYKGFTRGIQRSASNRHFLNAVTIDLSTGEKNVCLKLSQTFHVAGPDSLGQAIEAFTLMQRKLEEAQRLLDYLHADPARTESTLTTLLNLLRGEEVLRADSVTDEETVGDYRLKFDIEIPEETPHFDHYIAGYFLNLCTGFVYWQQFKAEVEYLLGHSRLISPGFRFLRPFVLMENVNFHLGYSVYRTQLSQQLNGLCGFHANFNNQKHTSVTVHYPYTPSAERAAQIKNKKKQPCMTFKVRSTGSVMFSGPGRDLMEEVYYKFLQVMDQIYSQIVVEKEVYIVMEGGRIKIQPKKE